MAEDYKNGIKVDRNVDIDLLKGPYSSVAEANAKVTPYLRSVSGTTGLKAGRTVIIDDGTTRAEYWWDGGTADSNLVAKTTGGGGGGGLSSFNGRTAPAVIPTAGDYDAFYYTEAETDTKDTGTLVSANAYTDTKADGLQNKPSVEVASTGNLVLSGNQTIDGEVNPATVLVKDNTVKSENGVYTTSAGAWTRRSDMNAGSEFPYAYIRVNKGRTNANTQWKCINSSVALGVTDVLFEQVPPQRWSLDLFQIRSALSSIFNAKYISTTSASRTSNVATLVTLVPHTFKVGNVITSELPDVTYNGTFTITAVGSTTISYANVGADSASATNDGGVTLVSPRVASIINEGDSIGVSFISSEFVLKMYNTFGFRGLLVSRTLGTPLGTFVNIGGTTDNNAFNLNPGGYVDVLSAGNQLEVKVAATDKTGNTYKVNQAQVVYVKYASGGTFKCQQKAKGKINWEDIVGFTAINTVDATEQLASVTVPFTLGAEFRIVANTSTIKISCVLLEDTTVAGLIQSNFARGGTKILDLNTITQTSLNVLMGVIKPDLITCTYKDAIATIATDLETQQGLYNTAYPSDWLFITPYPGIGVGDAQYDIWINHAKKYNKGWFDTRVIVDNYQTALDRAMLRDTTHMSTLGGQNGEAIMWDIIGLDKGYQTPLVKPVNNDLTETKSLKVLGEDYIIRQRSQKSLSFNLNGGLKLSGGTTAQVINHVAITSVGTGSFTMVVFMKVPNAPVANTVMSLRSTPSGGSADDSIEVSHSTGALLVNTRIAGVSYSWSYLNAGVNFFANNAGKVVMLALRRDSAAVSMVDDPFTLTVNKLQYRTLGAFPVNGLHTINSSYFVVGSGPSTLLADLVVYKAAFYNTLLTDAQLDFTSDTGIFPSGALMSYNMLRGAGRACKTNIPGQVGRLNTGTIEWLERGPTVPYPYSGTISNEVNSINIISGGSAGDQVLTLPAAPEFGDTFLVIGRRNGLWEVQQPANTQIVEGLGVTVGTNATTLGVGGKVKATGRYDTAMFRCINDARTITGTGTTIQWVIEYRNSPLGLVWT